MDAVRTSATQRLVQIALPFVVDGGVIAEFLQALAYFFGSARYAYCAAPLDLGDLPHARPDRACRGRNDDGVSGLGLADVEEAEIGGKSVESQDAEVQRERQIARNDLKVDMPLGRRGVFLPAEQSHEFVADRIARISALNNFADGEGAHRVANFDAGPIGAGVGDPSARRRVAGKIVILNEEFALVD